MKMRRSFWIGLLALLASAMAAGAPATAQLITGTPGSPGATTTIPGTQLPAPEPRFGGVIKDDARNPSPGGRRA
jgi:hypothetical protein